MRIDPDRTAMQIFVLKERYRHIRVPFHRHRRAQLIHVSQGTLTVATQAHQWTIPPQRGVWIAPGTEHRITSGTPFVLTTCYIEPELFGSQQEGIVAIDALTHALLPEVAELGSEWSAPEAKRLAAVLLDRLVALPVPDVGLPIASTGPLLRLVQTLLDNPETPEPLSILAPKAGLSERSAARHFKAEFGMSFGVWRRQLRLQTALARLGEGLSVTQTAFEIGYKDVSSFITAFRAQYGASPGQIFREHA